MAPWRPRPTPSGWALVADNLAGGAGLAATLARLRHPGKLAAQARVLAGAAQMAAGGRPQRSRSLRRPAGGRRRLAVVRAQLTVVKDVAHGHGATVNDLLLAAVTGGLRALLLARGTPVDAGLILYASVPVALRAQSDTAALGNQVGLMIVPLPVGEPDPVQRLGRSPGPPPSASVDRSDWPACAVGSLTILRALNRYSRHQRIVDLFVTNVPGPQRPLYLLGARLLEAFPVVQVAGNVP